MLEERWQTLTTDAAGEAPAEGGLVCLDDLCALSFTGPDVVSFLQGYLTCDTTRLDSTRPQPAALCNLKGRVIAFGWVLELDAEHILWIIPRDLSDRVAAFLKPYLRFSKTRMAPYEADHLLLGCRNPQQLDASGAAVSLHFITSAADLDALCRERGIGDPDAFAVALIQAHIPLLSLATSEQYLPQMLNLVKLGAVDFNKGCYLGQEVVARAQHRGQVKRSLRVLTHADAIPLQPGAEVCTAQGRAVGTIISCAVSGQEAVSLAVVQNDAESPFQEPQTGITLHS